MNLPNELIRIIQEKHALCIYSNAPLQNIPEHLAAIVEKTVELFPLFKYDDNTLNWLVDREYVQLLDWVFKHRNEWHELEKDIMLASIIDKKPKVMEWADSVILRHMREDDVYFTFTAVREHNDYAVEFLRARGYRWTDKLLSM